MKARFAAMFKKVWPVLRWILLFVLSVILASSLIVFSHKYEGWGLNKSLWDWLDLLIVPAVLALGALWFNTQNQQREREIASERN